MVAGSGLFAAPRSRAFIVAAAGVVLVAIAPLLTSYWVGLLTQVLIFALLAMSLDLLLGYAGLPSLGHAGIFGVAAYTVAVLSTSYQAGFVAAIVMGVVAGTPRSGCWCPTCATCTS
jgi:branched-chain amino acid transport system permease protein